MSMFNNNSQNAKNKLNFFLNTYEQQTQIENRLNDLFNCLKITDDLRNEAENSKKKLKEKLAYSFGQIRMSLSNLENKIITKFETELITKQIQQPVREMEYDINQLIGNLNSLSMLNDSEKYLCLTNIDSSINKIKENLNSIQSYKKNQLDNLNNNLNHDMNDLLRKQVDRIQKVISDESLNLNAETFKNQSEQEEDYKKWLYTPKETESEFRKRKRANSFEFINFNQELDSIDIIDDFDDLDMNKQNNIENENSENIYSNFNIINRFTVRSKDDLVTPLFNDIYEKPIDYWLLKTN